MNWFLGFFIALFLCYPNSKGSFICEQKITASYLDIAVDLITKAKVNFPKCEISDCRRNLTELDALDCSDWLRLGHTKSGVYMVWPVSRIVENKALKVYCDMETDGGGWTVIQRRGDFGRKKDFFYKDWKSYKEGFGDLDRDFWLGNENIFALTNQKLYSVRFDLKSVDDDIRFAQYDSFWIDDEYHKFMLHIANYSGNAGDSMTKHKNQKFSTFDQDNDTGDGAHCAEKYKGAWWYNHCLDSNLNGLYLGGPHESEADGINWFTFRGYYESLATSEIKIRPKI